MSKTVNVSTKVLAELLKDEALVEALSRAGLFFTLPNIPELGFKLAQRDSTA